MTVASLCLRSVIVQVAEIVGIDHPRIFAIVDEVGPVVSIVNGRGTPAEGHAPVPTEARPRRGADTPSKAQESAYRPLRATSSTGQRQPMRRDERHPQTHWPQVGRLSRCSQPCTRTLAGGSSLGSLDGPLSRRPWFVRPPYVARHAKCCRLTIAGGDCDHGSSLGGTRCRAQPTCRATAAPPLLGCRHGSPGTSHYSLA